MPKTVMESPEGDRKVTVDGNRVCFSASPEKCHIMDKKVVDFIVDILWHRGWKMTTEET